jgi:hypothetical protein
MSREAESVFHELESTRTIHPIVAWLEEWARLVKEAIHASDFWQLATSPDSDAAVAVHGEKSVVIYSFS